MISMRYEPDPPYSDEEHTRIQTCCAELLMHWAIVKGKDKESRRMWDDIASARYRPRIRENLEEVGYQLEVVEAVGREVAYVRSERVDMRAKFNLAETITLVRMYQLWRQNNAKVSLLQTGCVTDVRDLLATVQAHKKVPIKEADIKQILYHFEHYNICSVKEKRKKDFSLNTQIVILPAIACMIGDQDQSWEIEMLRQYAADRLAAEPTDEITEEGEGETTDVDTDR